MNISSAENVVSALEHTHFPLWHAEDISSYAELIPHRHESELSVVISVDYPYRVLQQTSAFSKIFGFMDEELRMVSLRVIFGPDTDVKKLQTTISNIVRFGEQADCFTFYKKNGDDVKFPLRGCMIRFNGCEACRLDFDALEFAAGNDLPSGSRSEIQAELSNTKPSSPAPFICAGNEKRQFRKLASAAVPATSEVDPAVLLHIKAVRKAAAASKGSAKGCPSIDAACSL